MEKWYIAGNDNGIPTPALLLYPERIKENIRRMIAIAGTSDRLRPHVKTHKMSEVVSLHMKAGIEKFKCSTIAEAEMAAMCGAKDILLAMQPVGYHIDRFFKLIGNYPETVFSAITDSHDIAEVIATKAKQQHITVDLWLDINNGMNRTGVIPDEKTLELYRKIAGLPFIRLRGLHVYDGHIHEKDIYQRTLQCEHDFIPVMNLIKQIESAALDEPLVIAGGTPTFPIHAKRDHVELSPGTCVLWDYGYSCGLPDLEFLHAAILLTSVVSKPGKDLLCLDLGHKALAAEMPHPRVFLPEIEVNRFVNHNEEHLVIETPDAYRFKPGDLIHAIPWHICPTVAHYDKAYIIQNGQITGHWNIDARDRIINI